MADSNQVVLDFEKNIVEIEEKLEHLKALAKDEDIDILSEIKRLEQKLTRSLTLVYQNLTAWQKAQIARHPQRPHCLDYINALIDDFVLLCGDRSFADDEAMVAGIGKFDGVSVVVIGQEKGNSIETRMKYNFGMAK
ncbi:MAG: acetyl-CoA carboxylase carboxyl transferase subunit alpha, partial [Alphaproteobacteria bacterium]|nr:acetyl-CoA carboxylase carboxyl transferase subunit alpha [Alphaproteobacteria bacterium]